MKTLRSDHPAVKGARTIFLKSVKDPKKVARLLQPASTNTKMGGGKNVIVKGQWRGMPLYLLTMEERKTCPSTCQQWRNCYGNNMPFANRIDHTAGTFFSTLSAECTALARRHPNGFVVRLHVLGDFFSKTYVSWWGRLMKQIPQLRLYGYTHRWPEQRDGIGKAIQKLNAQGAMIRFSDRGGAMSANVGAACKGDEVQCPEEVGKTESCLTCGLCWSANMTDKAIKFLEH